jgi:crotonobetainyl-CoA:carnitine CoA-transferase CaiB-like acyl-CoA transferase
VSNQPADTAREVPGPLAGVRVLNLGGVWAGRVASMLLADQGAEVLEIDAPHRRVTIEDAMLGRGKKSLTLDLTSESGKAHALRLARDAHIVIDNLGSGRAARFGIDYATIAAANEGAVYVSMPGFASGSPSSDVPAWEGVIAASGGVYTDLGIICAALGGTPVFTAVPMASAYGAVHAAIAAMAAFHARILSGRGRHVEVPLADALMSSMSLLAMEVEGQPQRFDLPPISKEMREVMLPILRDLADDLSSEQTAALKKYMAQFSRAQFAFHECADGRMIFLNSLDHLYQSKACLQAMGLLDELLAQGMIVGTPYEEGGDGNNISNAGGLSAFWNVRLKELLAARFKTRPAAEWEAILQRAKVPVAVVRTADEWLALPQALAGANVACLRDAVFGMVNQAGRFVTIEGDSTRSPDLRPRESVHAGYEWRSPPLRLPAPILPRAGHSKPLADLRVLDLSNIIAGPVAARTLRELGAEVIRVDAPTPLAGPRMTMWFGIDVNQGKRAIIADLKTEAGQSVLKRLLENTDVVIHNFLDDSAKRLGISAYTLEALKPGLITCEISAWGGPNGGPFNDFPAFDPVLQAATGITARYGTLQAPALHGIASCVDYISGFTAAAGCVEALVARQMRGQRQGAHVRTSLAMGAQLVQFPYMVRAQDDANAAEMARPRVASGQNARGFEPGYALYRAKDGWVFLACREPDQALIADRLEAAEPSMNAFADAIARKTIDELRQMLETVRGAAVVPVVRLDALRKSSTVEAGEAERIDVSGKSIVMVRAPHPHGTPVTLPIATWYRWASQTVDPLSPAPAPGTHTAEVLEELKYTRAEIDAMFKAGVTASGWNLLKHYLPL